MTYRVIVDLGNSSLRVSISKGDINKRKCVLNQHMVLSPNIDEFKVPTGIQDSTYLIETPDKNKIILFGDRVDSYYTRPHSQLCNTGKTTGKSNLLMERVTAILSTLIESGANIELTLLTPSSAYLDSLPKAECSYKFTINKRPFEIFLKTVNQINESVGSFYFIREKLGVDLDSLVLQVDVGTGTVIATVRNSELVKSVTVFERLGLIWPITRLLKHDCYTKLALNSTNFINALSREQFSLPNGQSFEKDFNNVLPFWADEIMANLLDMSADSLSSIRAICFTGGGSKYLSNFLEMESKDIKVFSDHWSNIDGARIYLEETSDG